MSRPRDLRTETVTPCSREDLGEAVDARVRRPLERNPGGLVERQQVHLPLDAVQQPHQAPRVLRRVVHVLQHHVFERDAIAALEREAAAGVEQLLQPVLAVDRHQQVALILGRRVQRDRQVRHERLGRQPLERRQHADGRERDPPRRNGQAVLVGEDPQRLHRRVVVVQRFAHAHQHDVEALAEHPELAQQHADLADDFAGRQVADDAHLAGQAEGALHRAADLGREAEGLRRRVGDEDRLDLLAVGEAEQELGRAVGRRLAADQLWRGNEQFARELAAELAAEVGHRRRSR